MSNPAPPPQGTQPGRDGDNLAAYHETQRAEPTHETKGSGMADARTTSEHGKGRRGRAKAAGKRSTRGKATALSCHLYGGSFAANAEIIANRTRMNVIERIADAVQNESDRILSAYWRAIDGGDWRASEALIDRHYGKSTQRIEQTTDERHARLAALTPAERAELRVELLRRLELETRDPRPAAGELEAGPQ